MTCLSFYESEQFFFHIFSFNKNRVIYVLNDERTSFLPPKKACHVHDRLQKKTVIVQSEKNG